MHRHESWTIKKAKHWRTGAFELWCWRRLVRVTWTARRSNQSILKDINPEYSLEGLMIKLKLWSFGHLMWRTGSLKKTLMLGKIRKKWEDEMVGWHHISVFISLRSFPFVHEILHNSSDHTSCSLFMQFYSIHSYDRVSKIPICYTGFSGVLLFFWMFILMFLFLYYVKVLISLVFEKKF